MLVGIDQGEIISPLLWCIYYDPLLCRIQKLNMGYEISGKKIIDIYNNIHEEKRINVACMAYMDDTDIILDNKEKVENILRYVNEFNNLNDIQINKEKTEILLRKNDKKDVKKLVLEFGDKMIEITPIKKDQSLRILGVWFNAYNKKDFVLNQVKKEVQNFCELLKRRRVTDKHLAYLFNSLVLPKIEYRAQAVVFSENEIEMIMSPFRKLFKNKLAFASSAPNSIVENSLIYKVRAFRDNQAQAKIANFMVQINDDKLLGEIMDIRFLQIQTKLLLENQSC
jgi:hypothetical protein